MSTPPQSAKRATPARGAVEGAQRTAGPARYLVLPAIVLLAFLLRVLDLAGPSLWYDELLELERARLPFWQAFRGRGIDQDPPLLTLLLGLWLTPGGAPPAEVWARLPSVWTGTLAVALTGVWSRRLFGRRIGLLAALLAALAPVQIHYGREVNQYSAMLAWTVLALWTWERLRQRADRRRWLAHAAVSAGALATHYGLVFPLLTMGFERAWDAWREGPPSHDVANRGRRGPVLAYAFFCAALSAGLLALGLAERLDIGHVQKRFGGTHLQKEWAYILDTGWREVLVFELLPFSGGWSLPIVRVLSVLMLIGAIHLWRRHAAGRRIVGGVLGGCLVLTYLTSLFGLYPLGFRHGLFLSPLLLTCLAAGLVASGRAVGRAAGAWSSRVERVTVTSLTLATCAAFLYFAPQEPWDSPWLHVPREDFRPVAAAVAQAWQADDRAWVYHAAAPAFAQYGDRVRAAAAEHDEGRALLDGRPFDSRDPAAVTVEAERIAMAAETGRRVWLLWSHVHPAERSALEVALAEAGLIEIPGTRFEARGALAWAVGR
jgi:hypothetical protein